MNANIAFSHPTVVKIIKLLELTVGRDKVLRFIQYFARFLSYVLFRQGYSNSTVSAWKTLQMQVALSRKLFRAGKPIGLAKAASTAYVNKTQDSVVRVTAVGRSATMAAYLTLDTLVWLGAAKIVSFKRAADFQRWGYKFWLTSLILGIVNSLRKLYVARAQLKALLAEKEKDTTYIKKAKADFVAARHQLTWDVLDTSVPLTGLSYVGLDDGLVGLAGSITSLFGLAQVWAGL